jgi:hypothetical protein
MARYVDPGLRTRPDRQKVLAANVRKPCSIREKLMKPADYDDDYPSCLKTRAMMRICNDDLDPERITCVLGIKPSGTQVKGRPHTRRSGVTSTPTIGGWFLSSEGVINSRDVRRHVDWILGVLAGKEEALRRLQQEEGTWMDIFCYWLSAEGHGGPSLSPAIMRRLGQLELAIGFDIYGPFDD